jgi:hypothetical protein
VHLSAEAASYLQPDIKRNRAGETLRDWLIRTFESAGNFSEAAPSLFGTTIEVEDEIPLLLEALSRVTYRTPDDLIEAWVLEPPREESQNVEQQSYSQHEPTALNEEVLGKVAYVLDLGETLFEEAMADARRRLGGSYPEGEQAAQALSDVFKALRTLLCLQQAADGNNEIEREKHLDK